MPAILQTKMAINATQEVLHVIVVTMPMTLIPSMLADLSDDQEQRRSSERITSRLTSFGLVAGSLRLLHRKRGNSKTLCCSLAKSP